MSSADSLLFDCLVCYPSFPNRAYTCTFMQWCECVYVCVCVCWYVSDTPFIMSYRSVVSLMNSSAPLSIRRQRLTVCVWPPKVSRVWLFPLVFTHDCISWVFCFYCCQIFERRYMEENLYLRNVIIFCKLIFFQL